MRRAVLLLAPLVLAACSSGWQITNPSCEADVPALARDLTTHLALGGDGTGAFNYDPDGPAVFEIDGTYDRSTGDFSWTETAGRESYLVSIEVRDAYGYANENGDLDVVGTRVVTDILDDVDEQQFRIEREGCETTNRLRYTTDGILEREQVEQGSFSADGYVYERSTDIDGVPYEVEGSRLADGTYAESIDYATEGYVYEADRTGDLTDLTYTTEFTETYQTRNGLVTREGTETRATNGDRTRVFVQTSGQGALTWEYTVDYAGDGSGTITGGGLNCALIFTGGNCRYDCGGGRVGTC